MKTVKDIQEVIFVDGSLYVKEIMKDYYWDDIEELEKSKFLIGHGFHERLISSDEDYAKESSKMFNIEDSEIYTLHDIFEYLDTYDYKDQVFLYRKLNINVSL